MTLTIGRLRAEQSTRARLSLVALAIPKGEAMAMAMNSRRPAARLAALNRELGERGKADTTKQGVPILRIDGLVVCFFGRSDMFRLFAANYEKLADFDDTREGVLELAAYLDQKEK